MALKTDTWPAPAAVEKEQVADYSYSLRTHCAWINLPIREWIHYFVQGLPSEIRNYIILQQPENPEAAELS